MIIEEIDVFVYREIIRYDVYFLFLGYGRFLKFVCIFVNNVFCYGIFDRYLFFNDVLFFWKLRFIVRFEKYRGLIEIYLYVYF